MIKTRIKPSLQRAAVLQIVACVLCFLVAPGTASGWTIHRDSLASDSALSDDAPTYTPALTGDWSGVRSRWSESGVFLEGSYTVDLSGVPSGGVQRGVFARGLLIASASLDLDRLFGLPATSFYAELLANHGGSSTDYTGAMQGTSGIEADGAARAGEIWVEHRMARNRFRIKVGRVDANTEFAASPIRGAPLHSSAGVSPTVVGLPTYPEPAMSINAFVRPAPWLEVGLGLYDGQPGQGLFGIGTLENPHVPFWVGQVHGEFGDGLGTLSVGLWAASGTFEDMAGRVVSETTGSFAQADIAVWRGSENAAVMDIRLFGQVGWADQMVSGTGLHLGTGVVASGRDGHGGGVYLTYADLSDVIGSPFEGDETALELFGIVAVTPFVTVEPDIQYLVRPSGVMESQPVVVISGRLVIAL